MYLSSMKSRECTFKPTQPSLFSLIVSLVSVIFFVACSEQKRSEDQNEKPGLVPKRHFLVRQVLGEVLVAKSTKDQWKKARPGQKLIQGSWIQTGNQSVADLEMDDGSRFQLQENSRLILQALSEDRKSNQIKLPVGELLFQIEKMTSGKTLEMQTYTAVAAVRGTAGGLGTSGTNSYFYLDEGKLELKSAINQHKTMITANQVAQQTPEGFQVKKASNRQEQSKNLRKAREKTFDPKTPAINKNFKAPPGLQKLIGNNLKRVNSILQRKEDLEERIRQESKNLQGQVQKRLQLEREQKQLQEKLSEKSNSVQQQLDKEKSNIQKQIDSRQQAANKKISSLKKKTINKNAEAVNRKLKSARDKQKEATNDLKDQVRNRLTR